MTEPRLFGSLLFWILYDVLFNIEGFIILQINTFSDQIPRAKLHNIVQRHPTRNPAERLWRQGWNCRTDQERVDQEDGVQKVTFLFFKLASERGFFKEVLNLTLCFTYYVSYYAITPPYKLYFKKQIFLRPISLCRPSN